MTRRKLPAVGRAVKGAPKAKAKAAHPLIKETSASVQSGRLLRNPMIAAKVALLKSERSASVLAAKPLTPAEQRFIEEYLKDPNGTKAYMAVKPGGTDAAAAVSANRMLRKAKVKAEIEKRRIALSLATGITAERVLRELASLAFGDVRELVEYRVGACRYCWGTGHRFQRTPAEFERDEAEHDPDKGAFDEKGGIGYTFNKAPHADCPECSGIGKGRMIINDTRNLSPEAVALYAGVKQSKDGLEVKTHDKVQALDKLARHLGIYKADNEQVKPDSVPSEMIAAAMLALQKSQEVRSIQMDERRALGFTGD